MSGRYDTAIANRQKDMRVVIAKKAKFDEQIISGTTGLVFANTTQTFSAGGMPEFSQYTPLFNEFKFYKIKYTFRLATLEQTDNANVPRLYVRYTYDSTDTVTPTVALMQQLTNVKMHTFEPGALSCSYTVYPRVPVPTYIDMTGSTIASAFGSTATKQLWLDTLNSSTPHFGIKWVITGLDTGQAVYIDREWTVGFRYRR